MEVPTIVSFSSLHWPWNRTPASKFLKVVAVGTVGEVVKVLAQDRIQQRLVEQCTLTFQFLMVAVVGEAFKVSSRDRIHQC